jgi:hypothetical protein
LYAGLNLAGDVALHGPEQWARRSLSRKARSTPAYELERWSDSWKSTICVRNRQCSFLPAQVDVERRESGSEVAKAYMRGRAVSFLIGQQLECDPFVVRPRRRRLRLPTAFDFTLTTRSRSCCLVYALDGPPRLEQPEVRDLVQRLLLSVAARWTDRALIRHVAAISEAVLRMVRLTASSLWTLHDHTA